MENYEEIRRNSEILKISNGFLDSQDLSKISSARMKDIKEEEEESCLSNSKTDDPPKFKRADFSIEITQVDEEAIKAQILSVFYAILEKFKNSNPYIRYIEYVIANFQ